MVIGEELSRVITTLKENGNTNPVFEAHLIFRHYLNITPMDLVLKSKELMNDEILKKISDAVNRRIKNEPLQYILESQEFMGLDFYVDKNVLIPRQDTEILVEHLLSLFLNRGFTALDIGSGSGCISISLAHFNKKAYVRGLDISDKALEVATKNSKINKVDDRVIFEKADIFKYKSYGKYDLIVSNPPYIETAVIETLDNDVKMYEPHIALDGGSDGLKYYRHIVEIAPDLLSDGGILAFEIGIGQADSVSQFMGEKFCDIEIIKDLCGIDRVVCGKLKWVL